MSKQKRKYHGPDLLASSALADLPEEADTAEFSSRWGMYPTMISSWKKILLGGVTDLFEKGQNSRKQTESRIDEGYLQIGQIKIEQDFLAKGISRLFSCFKPQPPKSKILYCCSLSGDCIK